MPATISSSGMRLGTSPIARGVGGPWPVRHPGPPTVKTTKKMLRDDPSRMRTAARAPVIDHAGYDQQLGDEARHESHRAGCWWPLACTPPRPANGENHEEDAPR